MSSSTGMQQHQEPEGKQPPGRYDAPAHGSTGEGSRSAMARLISQEQSRIMPGGADEAPQGSA